MHSHFTKPQFRPYARKAGVPPNIVAARFRKSQQAIIKKAERLRLEVVVVTKASGRTTTSEISSPKEMPSIEACEREKEKYSRNHVSTHMGQEALDDCENVHCRIAMDELLFGWL
jgi:hypothetical protein